MTKFVDAAHRVLTARPGSGSPWTKRKGVMTSKKSALAPAPRTHPRTAAPRVDAATLKAGTRAIGRGGCMPPVGRGGSQRARVSLDAIGQPLRQIASPIVDTELRHVVAIASRARSRLAVHAFQSAPIVDARAERRFVHGATHTSAVCDPSNEASKRAESGLRMRARLAPTRAPMRTAPAEAGFARARCLRAVHAGEGAPPFVNLRLNFVHGARTSREGDAARSASKLRVAHRLLHAAAPAGMRSQ